MAAYSNEPERPRAEPEILPPERTGRDTRDSRRDPWSGNWPPYGAQGSGAHRIYVTRIGPLGFGLAMLVMGLLAAVLLLLLIGTALLWLPFVAGIVIIGFVVGLLRRL
jgi:hypothetical protein